MLLEVMLSKIHGLQITQTNLSYIGSISIGPDLLQAANLYENQKVQIVNLNNGERLDTYIIIGEEGTVALNGAAARKAMVDDTILVIAYGLIEQTQITAFKPTVIFPKQNRLTP